MRRRCHPNRLIWRQAPLTSSCGPGWLTPRLRPRPGSTAGAHRELLVALVAAVEVPDFDRTRPGAMPRRRRPLSSTHGGLWSTTPSTCTQTALRWSGTRPGSRPSGPVTPPKRSHRSSASGPRLSPTPSPRSPTFSVINTTPWFASERSRIWHPPRTWTGPPDTRWLPPSAREDADDVHFAVSSDRCGRTHLRPTAGSTASSFTGLWCRR